MDGRVGGERLLFVFVWERGGESGGGKKESLISPISFQL